MIEPTPRELDLIEAELNGESGGRGRIPRLLCHLLLWICRFLWEHRDRFRDRHA